MVLYNVTIKVHNSVQQEWLQWLKEIHVPAIMQTDCFSSYKIFKLLEVDDSEGPTYAIQYLAESKSLYNLYIEKFSKQMRDNSFTKWGDKFIAFRSVMQIVE